MYSGGNHQAVTRLLGAEGPDVIYCGDHLHADVVKCRKLCEWRTMLIVPELKQEVSNLEFNNPKYQLLLREHTFVKRKPFVYFN